MTTEIVLNVYDLHEKNSWLYPMGLGIFHSGVVFGGAEITYGGGDMSASGIYEHTPGCPLGMPGAVEPPIRASVSLGRTSLSRRQLTEMLSSLGSAWAANSYHVLRKNCNHFTDTLVRQLLGQGIPGWVNRLAWMGSSVECLLPMDRILPDLPEPSDDLETAWSSTAFRLSESEAPQARDNDERRALLAQAASRRLESDD